MKLVTVVGARPQFIKASVVSRALSGLGSHGANEIILHTGQHYDDNMSDVFFRQMGIPKPQYNLGVGSGKHGATTARMISGVEDVLEREAPSIVLLYGDTNSTLAGAVAASKMGIPIAHVEAGLRSFNAAMPEEINRVLTDMVASIMFCPTILAVQNLAQIGRVAGVHLVGDVMLDASRWCRETYAEEMAAFRRRLGFEDGGHLLATVHRAENTDDAERLGRIFEALRRLARDHNVVMPLHPRTASVLRENHIEIPEISILPPVSYVEMQALLEGAHAVLTDSGGLQKEAYFAGVPCVTLRDETEWEETVAVGWNQVVGTETGAIVDSVLSLQAPRDRPELYGNGSAGRMIAAILADQAPST